MATCKKCGVKLTILNKSWNKDLCTKCFSKRHFGTKEKKGEKPSKEATKERNNTVSVIIGCVLGWAVTKFVFLPMMSIFFKMPLWGVVLSYIWFMGVCIGAMGLMLSATTAVERVAYGKPPQEKEDSLSQIKKLKELKDSGAITEKEFKDKKKKLLEKI